MTVRFDTLGSLHKDFFFYGRAKKRQTITFYKSDLSTEFHSLKSIYSAKFHEKTLSHWDLINNTKTPNQKTLFSYLIVALRLFSSLRILYNV